jgi:hypothetical protein
MYNIERDKNKHKTNKRKGKRQENLIPKFRGGGGGK